MKKDTLKKHHNQDIYKGKYICCYFEAKMNKNIYTWKKKHVINHGLTLVNGALFENF